MKQGIRVNGFIIRYLGFIESAQTVNFKKNNPIFLLWIWMKNSKFTVKTTTI